MCEVGEGDMMSKQNKGVGYSTCKFEGSRHAQVTQTSMTSCNKHRRDMV